MAGWASGSRTHEGALGNSLMRKKITHSGLCDPTPRSLERWLDLQTVASVEVSSEDPDFPIEAALISDEGSGWRAAEKGKQIIRILFDEPRELQRLLLEFSETERERTQEFTLRWSAGAAEPFTEIVRQQWNFSPRGSTSEVEDFQVDLNGVSVLELAIIPDLTPVNARATLDKWRMM
jgi:hypothetical protein